MTTTETTRRINLNRASPEVYEAMMVLSNAAAKEIDGDLDLFTEQERAALALTEEMTDLTHKHVSDEVYAQAAATFTERELGQVIAMALTVNAWNRIGVTTRLPLPKR